MQSGIKKYLNIRLGLKDYIKAVMGEASENGMRKNIHDKRVFEGKKEIKVKTPLDIIPVFEKVE